MEAACCSYSTSISTLRSPDKHHKCRFSVGPTTGQRILLANPVLCTPFLPAISPPFRHRHHHGQRRPRVIKAVFERFTERAIKAVVFSQREARNLGKDMVFTQHLLLGLVAEESESETGFLDSGIKIDRAREAVKLIWPASEGGKEKSGLRLGLASDVSFSVSSKNVFQAAVEFSRNMGCNFIAPEHISLGLLTVDDGSATQVLMSLGANLNELASVAHSRIQAELAKDGRSPAGASKFKLSNAKSALVKYAERKKNKSALAQFCVDLTSLANEGRIDPVIGRETEIQRIVQIICRRTKNNPILLGDPGVGKTAIAEGLALKIANCDVPVFLLEKKIMSLDIGLLMAGAKERGELESRVTNLIKEVKESGDVILFIDEVHNLIGSGTVGRGNKGSGLDIANLLKPPLGRGELQCIASTTVTEHRIHFEKDKALARRFQPVLINEPSQEDALKILTGLQPRYESYHKCKYTLSALNAAVYLSSRYIQDRYLPDKAIDLIDEAGSRARMEASRRKKEGEKLVLSKSAEEYWQEIRAAKAMHELVLANKLKYYKDKATASSAGLEKTIQPPSPETLINEEQIIVGPEEIARVTSLWSGIPVQQLTKDETETLISLESSLQKRVIGQKEAVSAISRAVKRSRIGLSDPDRPISTLLFCGPTGVGKTELTKALSDIIFGSESCMIRLDMSEYMEGHTVSKIIGSPPGYIGFGEGGSLTESVRRKPFSVILFDEIEKAHPDIFNILLQVFEDGHLTDSQGRRVSFKNTLIIMTSNVGSTSISQGKQGLGFNTSKENESSLSYIAIKSLVMEELKAYFRPELLNRIDEVVVFRPLEKSQMLEILSIMLKEVKTRLQSLKLNLEVSDALKDFVCEKGYDRSYGARPLRRAISEFIEDLLSEDILSERFKEGDTILVDVDEKGKPFASRLSDQIELTTN